MRHIPEDELHACLDQALSRSQCVEIEHHLAECRMCRSTRDAIAALRDRTTALLVAASPRRIRPRPYSLLSAAHNAESSRRHRRIGAASWAASVVAALGLGWGLSQYSAPAVEGGRQVRGSRAPLLAMPLEAAPPARNHAPSRLGQAPGRLAASSTRPAPLPAPPRPAASEFASVGASSAVGEPVLDGVWRTVSWAATQAEPDEWVPRVEGVPVVQVKVRQAPRGGRPITLVTQQLANGQTISTVEGPSPEVAAMLSRQPGPIASAELQDLQAASFPPNTPDGRRQAASASRTLAIFGGAPPDSLKAFMLRVR